LGAKVISRREFLAKLNKATEFSVPKAMWRPQTLEGIYD
jgi:leucyl/phenylalanyl-tRNA--protein transferase